MAINVATLTPASEKAKNVATEVYVDNAIANIPTPDLTTNNDELAQRLGYLNYNDMVAAAISGNTVINGGYINTSLINAGAISASQINTNGLVADSISGTVIEGKTIRGAQIEGAVIRASYLDLDGELEVLTDYHISVATYNANPSLYTDAVLIDGNYRIPSISYVTEPTQTIVDATGAWLYGKILAYDAANVGHNIKSIKMDPTMTVTADATIVTLISGTVYSRLYFGSYDYDTPYLGTNSTFRQKFRVYIAGVYKDIEFRWVRPPGYGGQFTIHYDGAQKFYYEIYTGNNGLTELALTINGVNLGIIIQPIYQYTVDDPYNHTTVYHRFNLKVVIKAGSYPIPSLTGSENLVKINTLNGGNSPGIWSTRTMNIDASIGINNMIP